ncbi:MAG TPA: aldo/keto reductase [Burkholderiales bacterium]|nr:aldo/keto reductase [Burkholderiales bacterium]
MSAEALITRPIPASGEKLPVVGLGTWQVFDVASSGAEYGEARATMQALVDGGGKVVDSSPMYGRSESVTGDVTQELKVREKLFIATKVWTRGRDEGIAQMNTSVKRLRVDVLDLMQVHNLVDTETHLATLAKWREQKRVRYLGITHYHAGAHADLERALKKHKVDFVQFNFSMAEPEAEQHLLGVCQEQRAAVLVNRPFAEGSLFARTRGKPVPAWAAQELGIQSWGQFFLKWIIGHPAVTCVIPGTRNPRHLADNLGAARGALPDAAQREKMRGDFAAL